MNGKVNKYFLISLVLILFFGILSLYVTNNKYVNVYFSKIEKIFDKFGSIEDIFKLELDNYLNKNYVNKYSIKEIRDSYTNIKLDVLEIIDEINLANYYKDLNKKYLIDILEDVLKVINNDFLVNDIFNSSDETIIKNIQSIIYDFNKVLSKYNVFKINFGVIGI